MAADVLRLTKTCTSYTATPVGKWIDEQVSAAGIEGWKLESAYVETEVRSVRSNFGNTVRQQIEYTATLNLVKTVEP